MSYTEDTEVEIINKKRRVIRTKHWTLDCYVDNTSVRLVGRVDTVQIKKPGHIENTQQYVLHAAAVLDDSDNLIGAVLDANNLPDDSNNISSHNDPLIIGDREEVISYLARVQFAGARIRYEFELNGNMRNEWRNGGRDLSNASDAIRELIPETMNPKYCPSFEQNYFYD